MPSTLHRASWIAGAAALMLLSALPLASAINQPPKADAGADQSVAVGQMTYFDGSNSSDPNNDTLSYSWDFDFSDGIQEDATGAKVTHAYSSVGDFRVTLTVSDGQLSSRDESNVTVRAADNQPPAAVISEPRNGAHEKVGDRVKFDGSNSSDPEGKTLTYLWEFGDGAKAYTAVAYHTYTAPNVYQPKLTVNDSKLNNSASIVLTVTAAPGVGPPGSPEWPQSVIILPGGHIYSVGQAIFFKGSQSTGNNLTFCWDFDQSDGIPVTDQGCDKDISDPFKSYNTTGNYTVTLIVTDQFKRKDANQTWVNITLGKPPVANAGPDLSATVGAAATFSGTGSDTDGYLTRYEWDFQGDGIFDWSSTSTGRATWTYNATGEFDAVLRVTDDKGLTGIDTCHVKVTKNNRPPAAETDGDKTAYEGDTVSFEGTGSDPDGTIAKYEWDFEHDGVVDYTSMTSGKASHAYPSAGTYEALFTVTDDAGATASAVSTVTVNADKPPVASAGEDQSVDAGTEVQFDGTRSKDPEGGKLTYLWDFGDGSTKSTASSPTHTYAAGGIYTVSLTVTDDHGKTGSDTATVTVTQTYALTLTTNRSSSDATSGSDALFTLTVGNTGNGRDTIQFQPIQGTNSRWARLDRTSLTLDPGRSASVGLTVTVPPDADANERATLTVSASSLGDPSQKATVKATVTVKQVYRLKLVLNATEMKLKQGATATLTATVTNEGNGPDRITVQVGGGVEGWAVWTPRTLDNIPAGGSGKVTITITVPDSANPSDYTVTVTARSGDPVNTTVQTSLILHIQKTGTSGGRFIPGFGAVPAAAAMLLVIFAGAGVRRRMR